MFNPKLSGDNSLETNSQSSENGVGETYQLTTSPSFGSIVDGPVLDDMRHGRVGDGRKVRTRMPLEGHSTVLPSEGGIIIFKGVVPSDWASATDAASLAKHGKDFGFPGEKIHMLVHITPLDPAVSELSMPTPKAEPSASELESPGASSLARESHASLSASLHEAALQSHFYVRVSDPLGGSASAMHQGCTPLANEHPCFLAESAGGQARRVVDVCVLKNGDVAVLLEVVLTVDLLTTDASVEVLQFVHYNAHASETLEPGSISLPSNASELVSAPMTSTGGFGSDPSDPAGELMQWLLPLDRPIPSPSPPGRSAPTQSSWTASPSFSLAAGNRDGLTSAVSSGFSLNLQRYPASLLSASTPDSPAVTVAEEAESGLPFVGNEGLLSFRGAVLEPQRFASQYGLHGAFVPGRRWVRRIALRQPITVESYSAQCNTQDILCMLVQNCLPEEGAGREVVIYVDAISMERSGASGTGPEGGAWSPLYGASVEADYSQGPSQLPNLVLRPGEQHSFILRPTFPPEGNVPPDRKPRAPGKVGFAGSLPGGVSVGPDRVPGGGGEDGMAAVAGEHVQYSAVISCRCSHSDSQLLYRHALAWRPRPPRDLLLSVSMDPTSAANGGSSQSQFYNKTVTVRATNLTDAVLTLTLLAPSSMASTALSQLSFPTTPTGEGAAEHEQAAPALPLLEGLLKSAAPRLDVGLSRTITMPPLRRLESMVGSVAAPLPLRSAHQAASAAELVAEQCPQRTHIWLQSVVPIGLVPPQATAEVRCQLLPLLDGVITLDTLHVATKARDMLYIPEKSLQVFASDAELKKMSVVAVAS